MIKRTPKDQPSGYEDDLSDYGPWIIDSNSGKTIGWGFRIERHLGEERFQALGEFGNFECVNGPHYETTWYLISDWLTPEEAICEYGEITRLVLGPMKGFRSVTYGSKTFISEKLDPRHYGIAVPHELVLVLAKGDRRMTVE
jgi:hypothetical protein